MAKYEKEKVIGSGTYGNVWLVKSKCSRINYVMKEVKLTSLNPSERQQALSEVTILSKCKHKNIIRYKDALTDQNKGILSIVMEYADGGDLHSAILAQKGVPFKESCILVWFIQICLALQYIHYQNILHRDLKSQNIFLTRNKVVKVGDFGIARFLRDPKELATTAIGTPYYLSPEICQRKPYNYKSDMWALGCVLFEMVALTHPFQAYSFPHLVSLILKGKRKDFPRHCSPLIQDLVNALMNAKPEKRPSTDELLALPALQSYLTEYTAMHCTKESGSLLEVTNEKVLRRHSLSDALREVKETTLKRRASSSATNPRPPKIRLYSASKERESPKARPVPLPRPSHLRAPLKPSPLAKVGNDAKERRQAYHVASPKPTTPKPQEKCDSLINPNFLAYTYNLIGKLFDGSSDQSPKYRILKEESSPPKTDDSDCGYQSEEIFKKASGKLQVESSKKRSGSCSTVELNSEKCTVTNGSIPSDDVFISKKTQNQECSEATRMKVISMDIHCHHSSRCYQCMLDMLWKNRIRGSAKVSVDFDERSKFVSKLQSVFDGEMFAKVYQALASRWEGNEIGSSFETLMKSLNYNQVQHLPLMLQLIQLDVIMKCSNETERI